jgi:hypothetical protein
MSSRSRALVTAVVGCALLASAFCASTALASPGQPWSHAKGSWAVAGVPLKSGQVEPITPFLAKEKKVTFEWSFGANRIPINWSCTAVTKSKSKYYPSQLEYGGKGTTALVFTGCAFTNIENCAIRSDGAALGEIRTEPMSIALTGATTATLTTKGLVATELKISQSGLIGCTISGSWPVRAVKESVPPEWVPPVLSTQISGEYKEMKQQPFTINGSTWVSYNPIKVSGEILFELG